MRPESYGHAAAVLARLEAEEREWRELGSPAGARVAEVVGRQVTQKRDYIESQYPEGDPDEG